jgi:outer membrane protein OmpA-like peptidoglycan-associated protein
MHALSPGRAGQRGQGSTPIFVFLGIVVLSLVFFFALTLPRQLERKRQTATQKEPAQPPAAARVEPEPAPAPTPPAPEANPPPDPAPAPAPAPTRFPSPRAFVIAVSASLAAGDPEAATRLLGDGALTADKAAFLTAVLTEANLRPVADAPIREVGDVGALVRWAIRLSPAAPAAPPGSDDPLEIEVDVERDPDAGWKATAVHFPQPLRDHIAARLGAARVPPPVAAAEEDRNDPLKITERFLRAVLEQNYALARSVTDTDKVTREKVAGLCILFEEGGYKLADHRPLSATATGSDSAWVIIKVASTSAAPESDFGIELQKAPDGQWQVVAVNFSKLLAGYMQQAGVDEGVAYAPIVKSPAGGESLVIYFDFDEAGLVPRAQRQLEIVANLLRDDTKRKIRLSGFADAIGSDEYNRRLSSARAYAAKNALIALGVSPDQIVTEGLGKLQPLDANTKPDGSDNPEGRSRNRRTEIFLDF